MTSNSSVTSPSLLRLAEAMYPAALKTLSTFAEVAGIRCRNTMRPQYSIDG